MVEATKSQMISNGSLSTYLKSNLSLFCTRRSKAFVYGIMFIFVALSVFLAFSPSSSSSSPWFMNVFTLTTSNTSSSTTAMTTSSSIFSDQSYRSQFSSIFSHFFPNSSRTPYLNVSPPSQSTPSRLQNTTAFPPPISIIPNGTIIHPQEHPIPQNKTTNSTSGSGFSERNRSGGKEEDKIVREKAVSSNFTASLSKKHSSQKNTSAAPAMNKAVNGTAVTESGKGKGDLIESLVNCEIYDGEWVRDDSYPLYKPGSCSLIDEQFNCYLNGRPDSDYQKLRWMPKGCILPRLNGSHMLELLRGKRLVFVGDSLNRNMWESLFCILRNSVKDKSKVYEAFGRHHFRTEASYSFVFEDYKCTVEFFASPFLVRQWEATYENGTKKETLRLDLIGESSDQFKTADIIVFNTGHWWTHEKTSLGKDYYQEGSHVYGELNVVEAFRRALTTWARWVDANVNPSKTHVLFRGYSASHFSGGQWNSGGQCNSETQPIKNETYLTGYPWKMKVFESVMKGMRTKVSYLNITRITDYRKDGHPSVYRKQNLSDEEWRSPLRYQDCSHWCLPGVPDTWNELLYAELLRKPLQPRLQPPT
ncbi:hypothetical protein Nepgr_010053 [Nepenthes gracilis]|uniref:Trichome birefringence-like N-terminal domain-containing protein n=1 Tax=Nepenthes gracilis TaxID=150966 RepID=A0AAD3SBP3_NEPGR|nr:hypothetical protein Nepgr_010053 [Nepenthes gracilis]